MSSFSVDLAKPVIWTIDGNVNEDTLKYQTCWEITDAYIKFVAAPGCRRPRGEGVRARLRQGWLQRTGRCGRDGLSDRAHLRKGE